MPRKVNYFELGASLYSPCTHPGLAQLLQSGVGGTRSMVFCLEDAVRQDEIGSAISNFRGALRALSPMPNLLRFVRPRNTLMLAQLLQIPGIEKIDGFVLPKVDLNSLSLYKQALENHATTTFALMPTLETSQVLEVVALHRIRKQLSDLGDAVTCIRIGGNDLMNLLGIKRMPGITAYDTPLRSMIDQMVLAFRPYGYEMSAPVFDFIDDRTTLAREVEHDLSYGFYAKTAIHPNQVRIIEQQYAAFSKAHVEQARAVLDEAAAAVFQFGGQMMERTCHSSWAARTLNLANAVLN